MLYLDKIEEILETKYFAAAQMKKQAYICSPLRADKTEDLLLNMHNARAYMCYALFKMGMPARAPHAFLPMLLCDAVPAEREMALRIGLKFLEMSDTVFVCGNRVSEGMKGEIVHAAFLGKEIWVFDNAILNEVYKIVSDAPHGDVSKIIYDNNHQFMSLTGSAAKLAVWNWRPGDYL